MADPKRKVNQEEKDMKVKKEQMEIGTISFKFSLTRQEADEVINNPKGSISRKLRKYMIGILKAGSKKFLETKANEDVKNCKLDT